MKQTWLYLKQYSRWLIIGLTLFFLLKALNNHWQEVAAIHITKSGWINLVLALNVTLVAHIWSGWVWSWILSVLNQRVNGFWSVQVYLKTNIAKYLPGNVWHFYGRVKCATATGVAIEAATLSVLLEPLLMAAAALLIAIIGNQQENWGLQVLSLVVVAIAIHPWSLNIGIKLLSQLKLKNKRSIHIEANKLEILHYPLLPLLGELGFLGLRSVGFLLTLRAFTPLNLSQISFLVSTFSIAWLLGLIIPGAPGGIGVFEVTILGLVEQRFSTGLMLSTVALYRLISILAEAIGAGLALICERRHRF